VVTPEKKLEQLYKDAVEQILERVRSEARSPTEYEQLLLKDLSKLIQKLDKEAEVWISEHVESAWREGQNEVANALKGVLEFSEPLALQPINEPAVRILAENALGDLKQANRLIGRSVEDAYRKVSIETVTQGFAAGSGVFETRKRLELALVEGGLSAFTDSRGRKWRPAAYAAMVAVTVRREATNTATIEQLTALDIDLVKVSEHPNPCRICAPFQARVFSISGNDPRFPSLYGTAFKSGYKNFHPNCVVGETRVSGPRAKSALSRQYKGKVVTFRTASGKQLTATPNHPILTPKGWVGAGTLQKGDEVFEYIGSKRVLGSRPDNVDIKPEIKYVARSSLVPFGMSPISVPVSAEDFHGDGIGSKVSVVYPQRLLGCECIEGFSDLLDRLSAEVKVDQIISIEVGEFSGHVYNLETTEGWFAANDIITHNCSHSLIPWLEQYEPKEEVNKQLKLAGRPLSEDPRSKAQREAYAKAQTLKRQTRESRYQWERYRAVLGDEAPKTFASFMSIKKADGEAYQQLVEKARIAAEIARDYPGKIGSI
jgi:hypothetical protein